MTGPELIAHNETLPASPDPRAGDPDPRVPDGWMEDSRTIDTDWFPGRAQPDRPTRDRDASARLGANGRAASQSVRPVAPVLGFILAAASGALVGLLAGLLAGFLLAGVVSAAPRSASENESVIWARIPADKAAPSFGLGDAQGQSGAPHGAPSPSSPPAIGTRPAPTGDAPDLRTPPATSDIGTAAIGGQATWYCGGGSPCTAGYGPSDLIAAIDPTLGIEKGERLTVTYRGRSVVVRVVDVCACGGSRIIDLSRLAFSQLADPSLGVIPVSIEFGGPSVTPPATDR